jgi:hypothetical protein
MKADIILSSLSKLYTKREALNKEITGLQKKVAAEAKTPAAPAGAKVKAKARPKAKKAAKPALKAQA